MIAGERDKVFADLVDRVLEEPEIAEAIAGERASSEQGLREAAFNEQDSLLGQNQVHMVEEEYRAASGQIDALEGRHRRTGAVFWAGVTIAVLVALAASVVAEWSDGLRTSLTAHHSPSGASIALKSIGQFGFIVVGGPFAGVMAFQLLRGVARSIPWGNFLDFVRNARNQASVNFAIMIVAMIVLAEASQIDFLLWQLTHNRPMAPNNDVSWGDGVGIAAAAVFAASLLPLVGWLKVPEIDATEVSFASRIRLKLFGPYDADREEIDRLRTAWRDALSTALLGFMRSQIGTDMDRRYATRFELKEASGLRQVRGPGFHVPTPSEKALLTAANGMDGGSIALSGPRGVGKTDLLNAFCRDDGDRLGLEVTAPVVYDRQEFMLRLFARLCEHVISAGLEAKTEAAKHLQRIRYLQTRTGEASVSAGWKGFSLSARRGSSRARQPLTYPEIVDALKGFLQVTANELRPQRRLIIGIDELDRIEPAPRARDFINELKVVFDVPHCLFVLSVSDEALRESDLAPVGRRDAFDSAIDEIIRVEPLDYDTATRLLDTRAIGMPLPFIALFFCLSGGMPRDLLRTARAAAALATPNHPKSLPDITAALLDREKARLANAWDASHDSHTIHRYFLHTLEQIFSADLTPDQVNEASERDFPGSFEALTQVRRGIGITDESAKDTLQQIRLAWKLPENK